MDNKLHSGFKLNGISLDANALQEAAYSFVKEGDVFEQHIGDFLFDWLSDSETISVQTSGSTGIPKKIVLQKKHMVNSALATGAFFKLSPGDSILHVLPCQFIAGKMMLVRAMVLGLNCYVLPPKSKLQIPENKTFSFAAMVPLQALNSLAKLGKIQTLIIGGGTISSELKQHLLDLNTACFETYGMTETCTHIALKRVTNTAEPFEAIPNITLEQDERGCLRIIAPNISSTPVQTNDIVSLVSSHAFHWCGRADNVINSGGVKLFPEQIEEKLKQFIAVDFIVAGIPDVALGSKLILIVAENDLNYSPDDFRSLPELQPYERPKQVITIPRLCFTQNGKVQRKNTLALALK